MKNSNAFEALVTKIDSFIRLYYKNLIIRGIIYSIALLVIFFLTISILEYFSYFERTTRGILFFSYIIGAIALIGSYIINPLLRLWKIGNRISNEKASEIICRHFPEISDKLLNTLQLGSMVEFDIINIDILEAAILQKTEKIKHIQFTEAIDKRENIKRLPFALIPLFILLLIFIAAPTVIKDPTNRISNYNIHFERPMPFNFKIVNTNFNIIKGDDIDLNIKLEGSELPADIFVEYENKTARCTRVTNNEFIYRFRNLSDNLSFRLLGGGFYSEYYKITVNPKPLIMGYSVKLQYPQYIQRPDEKIVNTGDFSVPVGTTITWLFKTESTDSLYIRTDKLLKPQVNRISNNEFRATITAVETFDYTVFPINNYTTVADSLLHQVDIISDTYPEIQIEKIIDSNNYQVAYFTGNIKDDYGFNKLEFKLKKRNVRFPDKIFLEETRIVPINIKINNQLFFYNIDFSTLKIEPGDRIEYFFEVWDNDGVSGSKSSKSELGVIEIPGLIEREQIITDKQTELSSDMSLLKLELSVLSREIDQLQKSILEKERISWEDSNKFQEMLDRQLNLQKKAEMIQYKHTDLNRMQNDFTPFNEEIVRKQQELQKLFDDILTDEMKKLFEELQKLVDDMDRSKVQEMLKKMEMSSNELMADLDRTLELFKQLEMEKLITETVVRLNQLADKQDELANKTTSNDGNTQELSKIQEEISNEFEKLRTNFDTIRKKNSELEKKYNLIDTEEAEMNIENSINESSESIKNNMNSKAVKHQKDASKKMKELSKELMDMMMQMQTEQLGEDIKVIRKLLEDIIDISFDQEDLIGKTSKMSRIDPKFNELLSDQMKINNNLKVVEDSLNALAKRQLSIQQFIIREIMQINTNVDETLVLLEERNMSSAASRQQFVMTSVNNLALMLSEAMEKMNEEMASNSMDGNSCPNPGKGKGKSSMKSMKDLQQQLNQQMEQMKKSIEKPGESRIPKPGEKSVNEHFARMAAQQEALRREMKQYLDEMKKETGVGDENATKALEEMEQTEKDLVNKRITNETLLRQERIVTRLLESERAEMQRDKEEERESEEAKKYHNENSGSVLQFYREKVLEREMLRTFPIQTNSFYRNKIINYFIQVQ